MKAITTIIIRLLQNYFNDKSNFRCRNNTMKQLKLQAYKTTLKEKYICKNPYRIGAVIKAILVNKDNILPCEPSPCGCILEIYNFDELIINGNVTACKVEIQISLTQSST